ncbi:hypothetical protein YB2330_003946 [Saitoella coloradoensis]
MIPASVPPAFHSAVTPPVIRNRTSQSTVKRPILTQGESESSLARFLAAKRNAAAMAKAMRAAATSRQSTPQKPATSVGSVQGDTEMSEREEGEEGEEEPNEAFTPARSTVRSVSSVQSTPMVLHPMNNNNNSNSSTHATPASAAIQGSAHVHAFTPAQQRSSPSAHNGTTPRATSFNPTFLDRTSPLRTPRAVSASHAVSAFPATPAGAKTPAAYGDLLLAFATPAPQAAGVPHPLATPREVHNLLDLDLGMEFGGSPKVPAREVDALKEQLNKTLEALEGCRADYEGTREELARAQEEIAVLREDFRRVEDQREEALAQSHQSQTERVRLESLLGEECEGLRQTINQLREERDSVVKVAEEANGLVESVQGRLEEVGRDLEGERGLREEVEARCRELEGECERGRALEAEVKELRELREKDRQALTDAKEAAARAQEEAEKAKAKAAAAAEKSAEGNPARAGITQEQVEDQLRALATDLHKQYSAKHLKKVEALKGSYAIKYGEQIKVLEVKLQQAEAALVEAQGGAEEVDALRAEVEALSQEVQRLQGLVRELEAEVEKERREKSELVELSEELVRIAGESGLNLMG